MRSSGGGSSEIQEMELKSGSMTNLVDLMTMNRKIQQFLGVANDD